MPATSAPDSMIEEAASDWLWTATVPPPWLSVYSSNAARLAPPNPPGPPPIAPPPGRSDAARFAPPSPPSSAGDVAASEPRAAPSAPPTRQARSLRPPSPPPETPSPPPPGRPPSPRPGRLPRLPGHAAGRRRRRGRPSSAPTPGRRPGRCRWSRGRASRRTRSPAPAAAPRGRRPAPPGAPPAAPRGRAGRRPPRRRQDPITGTSQPRSPAELPITISSVIAPAPIATRRRCARAGPPSAPGRRSRRPARR